MDRATIALKEKASGQTALFEMPEAETDTAWMERADNGMVEVKEFPPEHLLQMEKEMLGLYISAHPLEHLRDSLEGQVTQRIADIAEMREGENVKIGGILQECRRITTRRGDNMLIAGIEDLSGSIGMVVFPKSYEKYAAMLNNDAILVVKGKINRDMRTEEYNIVVDAVQPVEELEKVRFLQIELVGVKDQQILIKMKEILEFFRGEDPVYINMDGRRIELGKGFRVDINPELVGQLEGLLGTGAVNVEYKAVPKERDKSEVNL
jgi:DNA polymerase-3 subunit alpha